MHGRGEQLPHPVLSLLEPKGPAARPYQPARLSLPRHHPWPATGCKVHCMFRCVCVCTCACVCECVLLWTDWPAANIAPPSHLHFSRLCCYRCSFYPGVVKALDTVGFSPVSARCLCGPALSWRGGGEGEVERERESVCVCVSECVCFVGEGFDVLCDTAFFFGGGGFLGSLFFSPALSCLRN